MVNELTAFVVYFCDIFCQSKNTNNNNDKRLYVAIPGISKAGQSSANVDFDTSHLNAILTALLTF